MLCSKKWAKNQKQWTECEIFAKNNEKFIDKKILVLYNKITIYMSCDKRKADGEMTNIFAAIDIFNLILIGCSAVLGVALIMVILFLALKCQVVYLDPEDGNKEIFREKHSWFSSIKIHSASKKGKRLIGWSKRPDGKKPLTKHKLVILRGMKLYAMWAEAPVIESVPVEKKAIPVDELDYTEGVCVKFNYVDTQTDAVIASEGFRLNAVLPKADVLGWGFKPNGAVALKDGTENYVFTINLYPVMALDDSDVVVGDEPFLGESVVDIAYTVASKDEVVYKESHYFKLRLPNDFDGSNKFLGWSVIPDGDVVIERGEVDSVFTIPLYAIEEAVAEEPACEPVIEEPVAEVVEEVVEEVAPEVVEEVAEEIVEEPKPLYEEIIEEYIPQPVVEEPVVEEPVAEAEPVIEEPVAEVTPEPVSEPAPVEESDGVLVPTYYDNEGNRIDIKYSRSFTANLIQSDDTVKDYYSELKNHILSYKGVKSRISWKFDSYNRGRDQLFKVKLRGKTICLYCALDPNEFDESKYHHEPIDAKIFEDVPMLVKIKSGLGLRKAKELVDITMAKFGIEKDEKAKTVDYVAKYPYEPNEPLLARKLIKALIADDAVVVMSTKPKEEPVIVAEPVVEEPIVEVAEPVIEEPVVEVVPEPVIEEPVVEEEPYVEPEVIVESVSAEEAHQLVEENQVELHVEEGVDYIRVKDNKKAIINVDTLSKNYEAHDLVTIESLKEKKLIDKKAKSVKVLARGILDKPLRVKAGEFSVPAVEMLLLTGGQAMHVVYKVKK